ncbi:hypothetical protein L1887_35156 [Cichorium endivia]|nr:hypothetical protein L1887_35156 [Cichorium endivia]
MLIIFCHRPISKKLTKSRTEVSVEEDEYPESDLSTPEYIVKKDLIQLQSKMATVSTQLLESIAKVCHVSILPIGSVGCPIRKSWCREPTSVVSRWIAAKVAIKVAMSDHKIFKDEEDIRFSEDRSCDVKVA